MARSDRERRSSSLGIRQTPVALESRVTPRLGQATGLPGRFVALPDERIRQQRTTAQQLDPHPLLPPPRSRYQASHSVSTIVNEGLFVKYRTSLHHVAESTPSGSAQRLI
jgi:hypothetical protein